MVSSLRKSLIEEPLSPRKGVNEKIPPHSLDDLRNEGILHAEVVIENESNFLICSRIQANMKKEELIRSRKEPKLSLDIHISG
jgi:hypothetical protein